MSALAFRPAGAGDIARLHRLIESAYRGDAARRGWTHEADLLDGQRTDAAELSALVANPARVLLMAEQEGGLIGCVQVADLGDGLGYLGMLTVDPERQAGGLGRELLEAGEAWARDRFGARAMEMTVIARRRELIAWYERRGYALTSETRPFPMDDPRFGLPCEPLFFVVLRKRL